MTGRLQAIVRDHTAALETFFDEHADAIVALSGRIAETMARGGLILVCGNGGSACDAMHIAGEIVGRFRRERRGYPAIALSADGGILTAIGNDYGFDRVFARQVEALGKPGDILIALTTSGKSPNILAALAEARACNMATVLLTGERGRGVAAADTLFVVPSEETARVQEVHITLLHALIDLADDALPGIAA